MKTKHFYVWNIFFSTIVVVFLAWLLYFREATGDSGSNVAMLPAVNATLNAASAVFLLLGFWAIKNKKEKLHKNLMVTAFCFSALFLVSYVYYHSLHGDTRFLGEGWIRPVYFTILITHILLSVVMLPLMLSAVFLGLTDRRASHRKVVKFTFPIWLYVSVTGVAIFFFLRHFS